jgi:hypothetical protein
VFLPPRRVFSLHRSVTNVQDCPESSARRGLLIFGGRDDFGVQGRSVGPRDLLDVESVAGYLLKAGSVFAFLAANRGELFPDELFADLFPSGRRRPSMPADVIASVIVLQARYGLSDSETVDAVTYDLRWKAACGLPTGPSPRGWASHTRPCVAGSAPLAGRTPAGCTPGPSNTLPGSTRRRSP